MTLNEREISTLLAALRCWEWFRANAEQLKKRGVLADLMEVASEDGRGQLHAPLSKKEIEALDDRLLLENREGA